jgi:hypothetical protein
VAISSVDVRPGHEADSSLSTDSNLTKAAELFFYMLNKVLVWIAILFHILDVPGSTFRLLTTFLSDQIKKYTINGACSTRGGKKSCIQGFGGET